MAGQGYPGASDVTRRLFEYWFDEDHEVADFPVPFRYYFCQREAIETLVWLVEIAGQRDAQKLIQSHATIFQEGSALGQHRVPDHHGRQAAASPLRAGAGRRGRAGPAAGGPAPLRLQDGHRLGQDLGDRDGGGLVALPQEARARVGAFDQLPDRRAERHRLPAAGEGLRQQQHLQAAPARSPGVAAVRAEGDPARRGHRAGRLGQPLPHQHPPALRVARQGVDTAERGGRTARQEAGQGPGGRPALHAGAGQVAQGPRGPQRRGAPRPRRGPRLEPVAAGDPPSLAQGPRSLARLLRHAQGPERDVLSLDRLRLPARPGGGGPHRQGTADRHQGGRPQAAHAGPGECHQGQRRREVRLLAACRRPALEGPLERLQEARHQAGALHHGGEERLRRRAGRVPLEDQGVRLQGGRRSL